MQYKYKALARRMMTAATTRPASTGSAWSRATAVPTPCVKLLTTARSARASQATTATPNSAVTASSVAATPTAVPTELASTTTA